MRFISLCILVLLSFSFGHANVDTYYGKDFIKYPLKESLHKILSSYHIPQSDQQPDVISDECNGSNCFNHNPQSYKTARRLMFGDLYLEQESSGSYYLISYYCQSKISNGATNQNNLLGPNKIPNNTILNTEHSWPQSKFSSAFPKRLQKSDLHALFPVRSRVNSIRGNRPFGVVQTPTKEVCGMAKYGNSTTRSNVFEPSDKVKGDIARAIFYFSVRYKLRIDEVQESFLRQWHQMDPVDAKESIIHERIFGIQNTRNPFIDFQELVQKVEDF